MVSANYQRSKQRREQLHIDSPLPSVRLSHRAGLYALSLWGQRFDIGSMVNSQEPCLQNARILLPGDWQANRSDILLYRAAVCHAAAHYIYGGVSFEPGKLRPRQQFLISLIEDARVEALSIQRFPGLKRLWLGFHPSELEQSQLFTALSRRLARSLLVDASDDSNAWVKKGLRLFMDQRQRWNEPALSHEIGLQLAHDIGQMRISMDEGTNLQIALYRDDNNHLWQRVDDLASGSEPAAVVQPSHDQIFMQESGQGRQLDLADQPALSEVKNGLWLQRDKEHAVLEFIDQQNGLEQPARLYPEWNYRTELHRLNWCSIRDWPMSFIDDRWADAVLMAHQRVLRQLQRVALAIRLESNQIITRQKDGDDIDLNEAVRVASDIRMGREPDMRIYQRRRLHHDRGLAILVLLDLSASGNDAVADTAETIVDLTRQATLLLAHTLCSLGEAFALHGFCSRGRRDVGYFRIKDFSDPFNMDVVGRIGGMQSSFSTRLGVALRHASGELSQMTEQHKLLLVVSDGTPSDIDVYDPFYLVQDARQAVIEAKQQGVKVYCLCTNTGASATVEKIFGRRRYRSLARVSQLPEILPQAMLSLVRHF